MRVATFNANSIRSRLPIILDWLKAKNPDLLCIQGDQGPGSRIPGGALAGGRVPRGFQR